VSRNKDLLDNFYGWLTGVMLETQPEPLVASARPVTAPALLPRQRPSSGIAIPAAAVQMARSA
jgi:hypothetical protein